MGHHIDDKGRFQSDKYPDLPPDKVVIDITDPRTWSGLCWIIYKYRKDDPEFAEDLEQRLYQLAGEHFNYQPPEDETVQEKADRETDCTP